MSELLNTSWRLDLPIIPCAKWRRFADNNGTRRVFCRYTDSACRVLWIHFERHHRCVINLQLSYSWLRDAIQINYSTMKCWCMMIPRILPWFLKPCCIFDDNTCVYAPHPHQNGMRPANARRRYNVLPEMTKSSTWQPSNFDVYHLFHIQ